MKRFLPSLLCLVLFSCTEYQYFTVSSGQVPRNANHEFVVENDTLKITYAFNGYHGPVKMTIFNKTNEPLEINWKKSAIIMNGLASGYYSPNLVVNGSLNQDSIRRHSSGSPYLQDVRADVYANEPSQFIPPQSAISKTPLSLPVKFLYNYAFQNQKKQSYSTGDYSFSYKRMEFPEKESPASFHSYLTFNYGGRASGEFSITNYFYISEVWQSQRQPLYLPRELAERGIFLA
jgi:hypothetical protein